MQYTTTYQSPLGGILLACDDHGLTGLWFDHEKYYALNLDPKHMDKETEIFKETKRWLDLYFGGANPDFFPHLHMIGTPFQISVWNILRQIPYGLTTTYGEIAAQLAKERNLPRMSAQAVGGAVGHNEISIIVPCHRVVGKNGSLTGRKPRPGRRLCHQKVKSRLQGLRGSGGRRPGMYNAFKNEKLESLKSARTFADGIQVKLPGELTYQMCREYVDDKVFYYGSSLATRQSMKNSIRLCQ